MERCMVMGSSKVTPLSYLDASMPCSSNKCCKSTFRKSINDAIVVVVGGGGGGGAVVVLVVSSSLVEDEE